jgi:hypothetical protein
VQKRERNLLIGLAGAGLVAWLTSGVGSFEDFLPFGAKRAELTDLADTVAAKESEELQQIKNKGQLRAWGNESLPPDVFDAQRVYQEWLVDLARLSGLVNIEPKLGSLSSGAGGGTYVPVPVTLTADATLEQLSRFLYHFERTRLVQRIGRLDIASESTLGDVPLHVTITAEGLSLTSAPDRPRLFPRTTLAVPLDAELGTLQVTEDADFPPQGSFLVRIGNEFLNVTARSGKVWTVARGVEQTEKLAHDAGAIVELTPRKSPRDATALATLADYKRFIEYGPFSKPRPPVVYSPRLTAISDQSLLRGTPLRVQARVSSWDPAHGKPVFELGFEAPQDMQVDADGWITWSPGPETRSGAHPASVIVTSKKDPKLELSSTFLVVVSDPNLPPRISLRPSTPVAFIGREWTAAATGEDPEKTPLRYSLGGETLEGLSVDSATGLVRWTPPLTTEPKDYTLQVRVEDGGNPPQSSVGTVTVKVEDDVAQFTFLVGLLGKGEEWTAWLYDRSTNMSWYLKPGSTFKIADVEGEVVAIDKESMTYKNAQGTWRLPQDVNLRQAKLQPAAAAPDPAANAPPMPNPSPMPPSPPSSSPAPAPEPAPAPQQP